MSSRAMANLRPRAPRVCPLQVRAATKVQSFWRGFKARMELAGKGKAKGGGKKK